MNQQYFDVKFVSSAAAQSSWPLSLLPEVVLIGRSNVGKSSFINKIFNRKNLAYVGQTPGKTRLLNFYQVADDFMVVDAPGYGYAKRSQKELSHYQALMESYLNDRENLKASILLLDIRRVPNQDDLIMLEYLHYHKLPVLIVLTKSDKLSNQKQLIQKKLIAETLEININDLIIFSAVKTTQTKEVFDYLNKYLT